MRRPQCGHSGSSSGGGVVHLSASVAERSRWQPGAATTLELDDPDPAEPRPQRRRTCDRSSAVERRVGLRSPRDAAPPRRRRAARGTQSRSAVAELDGADDLAHVWPSSESAPPRRRPAPPSPRAHGRRARSGAGVIVVDLVRRARRPGAACVTVRSCASRRAFFASSSAPSPLGLGDLVGRSRDDRTETGLLGRPRRLSSAVAARQRGALGQPLPLTGELVELVCRRAAARAARDRSSGGAVGAVAQRAMPTRRSTIGSGARGSRTFGGIVVSVGSGCTTIVTAVRGAGLFGPASPGTVSTGAVSTGTVSVGGSPAADPSPAEPGRAEVARGRCRWSGRLGSGGTGAFGARNPRGAANPRVRRLPASGAGSGRSAALDRLLAGSGSSAGVARSRVVEAAAVAIGAVDGHSTPGRYSRTAAAAGAAAQASPRSAARTAPAS